MTKRRKNPKVEKWDLELQATLALTDKQISRIIRAVNRLDVLRRKRKRLERSIAVELSATML